MYDIFIDTHFSAGHHLRNYPGNCEFPHGHNWSVRVVVRATELDDLGMGIDFRVLKSAVKTMTDTLDHRDLNAHPAFTSRNPSSENIARYLYEGLAGELATDRYRLHSVTVGETPTTGVTYHAG